MKGVLYRKAKECFFTAALYVLSAVAASLVLWITGYVCLESVDFLRGRSFIQFIYGSNWDPIGGTAFELLPALLGTAVVSVLAVIISIPLALGASLCFCHYLRGSKKYIAAACIDIIAGIPSVVIGFVGMFTLVRFLEETGELAAGETVFAAAVVLAFMLLPFEVSFLTETFDRLVKRYGTASSALGFDRLATLIYIIVPCARGTIFSVAMLALARGMGETMAVMMVAGNANVFPRLFGKTITIPARIALEMGMAEVDSVHYKALFAAAFVLIVTVFALNTLAYMIYRKTMPEKANAL